MLVGFTAVAAPLLVAIVSAAVQLNRLSTQSERLVVHGVQAARNNQLLYEQISALERTARLYQITGKHELLDDYLKSHERLVSTTAALEALRLDAGSLRDVQRLLDSANQAKTSLRTEAPNSARIEKVIDKFPRLSEMATSIANRMSTQIDAELANLQLTTQQAQQRLFWQTLLLVPMTLGAVGLFTYLLGRPIRAIDRAINELGRGTFSRNIEITGPRDLERLGSQLEWLRVRLLDLAQEKNKFLRHMSHELKTPLANIREGTELLMDGAVGELQSGQREVTAILRDNGMKLQRLIENLLSFSAWQAKSVGLEVSEFKLRPLIKTVLENQQLTLIGQRVRLDVQIEDLTLHGDRAKVRLILDNLLSNAVKFTPRGGTISMHARRDRDHLQIDVIDTGPGIRPEERDQIFEAFYQGRTPQGGHVKGTGIGLSVVIEFVNAHGGNIEIITDQGAGAHFRVRLPLRQTLPADGVEKAHAA
jgi:two-component system, NtrC family, sensor histidine kinase GlrK